jgi:hypothetical protein
MDMAMPRDPVRAKRAAASSDLITIPGQFYISNTNSIPATSYAGASLTSTINTMNL